MSNPVPDPTSLLASMFSPQHKIVMGPLTIACDMDPGQGTMGVTASFFGFVFFQQQFSVNQGTVTADCARGPMRVHLSLTPHVETGSIDYVVQACEQLPFQTQPQCISHSGTLGGFSLAAQAAA